MHGTRGAVPVSVRGDVHVEFVVRGVVVRDGRSAVERPRALGAPTADGDASAGLLESLLGSTAGADDLDLDERVPGVLISASSRSSRVGALVGLAGSQQRVDRTRRVRARRRTARRPIGPNVVVLES